MSATAERLVPDPVVAANFMAARLVGKAGERGVSSDALIAAASTGQAPTRDFYPRDLADLHRCLEAYFEAPHQLRSRMLPILADYMEAVTKSVRASLGAKP